MSNTRCQRRTPTPEPDDDDGAMFPIDEVKSCTAYDIILKMANELKFPYTDDRLICGKKVNEDAVKLRNMGNDYYRHPDREYNFQVAQQMYTQSISAASCDSLELAQGYANRATVLFARKHYRECLEDIERACAIKQYPQERRPRLEQIKQKALAKVGNKKKFEYHGEVPVLTNPNTDNPAVADCLELRENAEWGRHVVATRDIEPGEIILVEEAYVCDLVKLTTYWFCTECLTMCFNLIPCDGCRIVMFCSKECKDKANADYHKYECKVMQLDAEVEYLSLRMTLKSLTERVDKTSKEFSAEYERIKKIKLQYLQKHGRERENIIKKVSRIFDVLGMEAQDIRQEINFGGENNAPFLKTAMYQNYLLCLENPTEITNYHKKQKRHIPTGRGIYSFFPMFNHSCTNNVGYTFYGKKVVAIAMRKIEKEEQCFVNYKKFSPYKNDKKERQEYLKKHYYFTCRCKACVQDWPVYSKLSSNAKAGIGRQMLTFKVEETFKMVESGAIALLDETAKQDLLKECFQLADNLRQFEPCLEMDCLEIIFDELLLRGNTNPVEF